MNEEEKREWAIKNLLELAHKVLVNKNLLSKILTAEEKDNLSVVFGQLLGNLINTTGGKIDPLISKLQKGEVSDLEKTELRVLTRELKVLLVRVFSLVEFIELSI